MAVMGRPVWMRIGAGEDIGVRLLVGQPSAVGENKKQSPRSDEGQSFVSQRYVGIYSGIWKESWPPSGFHSRTLRVFSGFASLR